MKMELTGGRDSLNDAHYLRALYLAAPQKIVASLSVPHQKTDHLYTTRRARGQISGVEETLSSLFRYDTSRKNDSFSKTSIYSSRGNSDIASQLGVQPYTILPSPNSGYSGKGAASYGSSLGQQSYSSSPTAYKKQDLDYLV